MSTNHNQTDDTLDLVRSMRDTIHEFTHRVEDQNASIKLSFSHGFLESVPEDAELPESEMPGPSFDKPDLRDC